MMKQWRAEGEHGEKKINFWEGPTRISEWKEEQVRHQGPCTSIIAPSAWNTFRPYLRILIPAALLLHDRRTGRASVCMIGNDIKDPLCNLQIVLGVLGAWGVGIYTAMKAFGGKKEEPAPAH